jgi:glycosidase
MKALANDYMYSDVNNIMIFPDNHDMSRIYTRQLNEDFDKWKMAMTLFFTTRGTLQFYYGTEILMSNPGTRRSRCDSFRFSWRLGRRCCERVSRVKD